MSKVESYKSQAKSFRGFTLIELMVVFAIMGTLTVVGVNSFFSYSNSQSFQSAVSDVSHTLSTIRSRAITRVKPAACGSNTLLYYQLSVIAPGSTYSIKAVCGTTVTTLETRTLPTGVTFTDASPVAINFWAASGITSQAQTVTISGFGKNNTISVDANGVISVQ